MPLLKNCTICSKEFKTKPFFVKNGGGKYCSKECHYKGLKTGETVECFHCSKEFYRTVKALRVSKSKKYFCSKSCQAIWRNAEFSGEKHANWISGRSAYRSVLVRNKIPKKCVLCSSRDERVLAVHHIDKNRLNNKLENLTWLCHNCHFLVHHHGAGKEKSLLK